MNDLFEVKRYWSDSADEDTQPDVNTNLVKSGSVGICENQEIDILKKLKSKASNNKHIQTSESKTPLKEYSVKPGINVKDSVETEVPSVLKGKKKKKRKRSKQLQDAEDTNEVGKRGGFPVLGENLADQWRKKKFRRSLPNWLANPDVISVDLSDQQMAVESLRGLDDSTCNNLKKNNITHFFPVQRQVIPYMLANDPKSIYPPHDICVSAPTGSGKTLAYVLPIGKVL